MKTGVSVSETQKCLSTIATATGSIAIIGLAIAFVTNDFTGMLQTPAHIASNNSTITALKPIRSDPVSEPSGDDINTVNPDNGNDFMVIIGDEDEKNDETSISDVDDDVLVLDPDHTTNEDRPPVEIPMETIGFLPDSSEFVDRKAALTVLNGYLEAFDKYFERYPDGQIYLVGCIAKTADWSVVDTELSEQRAETVRQSFIELGVDAEKLVTIGLGISDPWRVDEWSNGYFDEDAAKINRRVWVVPDQFEQQVTLVISINDMICEMKTEE